MVKKKTPQPETTNDEDERYEDSGSVPVPTLDFGVKEVEAAAPDYVPEGFKSKEDFLEEMREVYTLDLQYDEDNREAALEDRKFVAGDQWDPVVLQQRAGLPCLTLNTIPQFTAQLVGDWRENKNAIKVLPSVKGTKDTADVIADLVRAIETDSRADRAYNNAFESLVQCGDGAFRVGVKYAREDVFDQNIVVEPIDDALAVVWDRLSIDPTGRDAKHCFVDDFMPTKEFKQEWPESDPSTLSNTEIRKVQLGGWLDNGMVKVTEYWRMIERDIYLVMFEDGTIYKFDKETNPEDFHAYIQKHGNPVKSRISPCRYAQMHLVTGWDILAGPYEWKLSRLPIIRMAGRTVTVGDKRVRYGLVRFMKDNVRLKNFWRSIAAEQLGYAPKAQWLATESAVEGKEDAFRRAHLTRDPLLTVNDEAVIGQNIQRIEPPPIQQALLNEAALNTQDMKDITGIHDASLGIKSNETSGRAIMARQREGDVASLTYYDNGNAAILEGGDVMVQLIGQIYDSTRIVRTIGEDESVKLQKINDPHDPKSPNLATDDYDVALATGPNYTTRRVEAADAMMQAVQVFPQLMQIAGDLVVKAQEWPGAMELAERLAKAVPPQYLSDDEKKELGMPPGPSVAQLTQQLQQMQAVIQQGGQELQKTKQENLVLKTKSQTENRRLDLDTYKAETDRLTAYANILHTGTDLTLQALEQDSNNAFNMTELAVESSDAQAQQVQNPNQGPAQNPGAPTAQDTADRDLLNLLRIKQIQQRLSANPASTPQID